MKRENIKAAECIIKKIKILEESKERLETEKEFLSEKSTAWQVILFSRYLLNEDNKYKSLGLYEYCLNHNIFEYGNLLINLKSIMEDKIEELKQQLETL